MFHDPWYFFVSVVISAPSFMIFFVSVLCLFFLVSLRFVNFVYLFKEPDHSFVDLFCYLLGFPGATVVKNQPASARDARDTGSIDP